MTIIVFLIDTSASMMQKTYLGTTYLDFARLSVEQFLKQRQRDPGYKGDRYMLMTFDEYPVNVKSGWKESQAVFTEQLKNLRAGGLCSFGSAVESVLRFVNLNRMQSGIENYGYGRYPCYSEHVVIIAVTDNEGAETSSSAQANGFTFSKQTLIGSELTTEPYRWDQRLFTLVLRFSGQSASATTEDTPSDTDASNAGNVSFSTAAVVPTPVNVPSDTGPIDALCSAMGGRSFSINSHRMLSASIETIIQRVQQNGVMIKLQKYGSDPPPVVQNSDLKEADEGVDAGNVATNAATNSPDDNSNPSSNIIEALGDSWQNQNVMLILRPNKQGQGHWPIPEAYSADSVSTSLPPRMAHPTILFRCENSQPMINQDFPFDKYELSSTPLSQYILARKDPATCWQVFVENSSRVGGIGMPFGYLKMASNMQSVILFLMPYNYPALLPLIEEAKNPVTATSSAFRQKMEKYLMTVPPYYYSPLRKAFKRINLLVPFLEDFNQQVYSYSIVSLMTKIKHLGKEEFDTACSLVAKTIEAYPPALFSGPQFVKASHCRTTNPTKVALVESELRPSLQPYLSAIPQIFKDLKICISDGTNGTGLTPMVIPSAQFKNPFDIERRSVISQLDKMRLNFDQQVETNALHVLEGGMPGQKIKLQHAEDLHCQPISKMGDYQEYVRCLANIGGAPLRELEPQAARPHAFGNPFKLDKKSIAVDEVGEMNTSSAVTNNNGDGRNERRARSQSASPIIQKSGMAGSFSSVPVAIRSKRKPGAIDPALLTSWKRRRRSSSVASDGSDALSFTSETSSVSELDDMLQNNAIENNDEENNDVEYQEFGYNYECRRDEDEDPNALRIYEYGSESSSLSDPELSIASPSNGFASNSLSAMSKLENNNHQPKLRKQHRPSSLNGDASRTNGIVKLRTHRMTAQEMCRKQLELSTAVRGIGDKYIVFNRCLNTIKDVSNDHERDFLLRFAMVEARRFKRNDLIKQLDAELKLISPVI